MTEPYLVWALLVGIAIGGALVWFVVGRLPRRTDDVGAEERLVEADWISDVINSQGGSAPALLVEQVLELHQRYVAGPPIEISPEERAMLTAELEARRLAEAEARAEAATNETLAAEEDGRSEPEEVGGKEVSETRR